MTCFAVLKQLLARCQDTADYNPQLDLTVFQFRYFVRSKELSFQTRLDEINDELQIISALQSENAQYIEKTMARLQLMGHAIPGQKILMQMSHLLLPGSFDAHHLVVDFLTGYVNDVDLKHQVRYRQGSCHCGIPQGQKSWVAIALASITNQINVWKIPPISLTI